MGNETKSKIRYLSTSHEEGSDTTTNYSNVDLKYKADTSDISSSRTGGIYIPPFKLARLQREIEPNDSIEYQRQEWERLKKNINGIVNKVTSTNIAEMITELLSCNIIRGRGILARTWIRAQLASPGFTNIYVSFLAIVNSKFPEIGELVIKRVLLQFRRAYKRNDRLVCQACVKCIAHLVNFRIAHEIMALQLLAILLENATDDSVEVAIEFIIEVGAFLQEACKQGLDAVFDRLRAILTSGLVERKTQYSIEKLWDIRRTGFSNNEIIPPELDLVEEEDQITHDIDFLDDSITADEMLNLFRPVESDVYRQENEKWTRIKQQLLGEEQNEQNDADSDSSVDSELEEQCEYSSYDPDGRDISRDDSSLVIRDGTEQDLVNLRKTVYLCIMSSLNYEECVHKLLKLNIKPGCEIEICTMLIDCCAMERTFQPFYALQAERLCKLKMQYSTNFQECFNKQYQLIHRLETPKLRNTAKFFTHLLYTDAIPWSVMANIQLTEENTTSSGRIFIKIIFQDLCHCMGIKQLNQKLHDPDVVPYILGLFPTENAPNIRFSINFFTAIGLGVLTQVQRQILMSLSS